LTYDEMTETLKPAYGLAPKPIAINL